MAGRDSRYQNGYGGSRYPQNYGPEDGYQGDPYSDGYSQDGNSQYGNYQDGSYQNDGYQDEPYQNDPYQDDGNYQDDGSYQNDTYQDGSYQEDGYYQDDGYYQEENPQYEDSQYGDSQYGEYQEDGYYPDDGYGEEPEDYGDGRSSRKSRKENVKKQSRGSSRGNGSQRGGKKKSNTKRIVLLVVEIAALLVVIGILYLVTRVEKVGKADLSESDLESNISDAVKQDETSGAMKGYRQIVFFGVDSTEGQLDQKTRSDAIIIASINQTSGEVKLVSVYRDTLMNLSDDTYNKCNAAYAKGGPEQAINMLNMNMDLNISDFVTIGFGGLTDVINALGGVEIDVDENEITHLNNYQSTMAKELGIDYTEVTQPGLQTLNGLQATAYCRIRYTYGWDYMRAARQREVLYQVIKKAQAADVSTLTQIATDAFDEIYTSYELNNLISDVTSIAKYSVVEESDPTQMQNGFPQADYRIQANLSNSLGDCVVPRTLTENVQWLHQFLFDDSSYQPSSQVQTISDDIDELTKDAVPEDLTTEDHA
jgi:LCP family protein required for cell wall assembly